MTNQIKGIGTDLSGVVVSDGFPVVIRECEKIYGLNDGELQSAKEMTSQLFK